MLGFKNDSSALGIILVLFVVLRFCTWRLTIQVFACPAIHFVIGRAEDLVD